MDKDRMMDVANFFNITDKADKISLEAEVLAMTFLGEVDEEMERKNINKKQLAGLINTSSSYITQLFTGNRRPNFEILAKMADALDMEFVVTTKSKYDAILNNPKVIKQYVFVELPRENERVVYKDVPNDYQTEGLAA